MSHCCYYTLRAHPTVSASGSGAVSPGMISADAAARPQIAAPKKMKENERK